ncbi:effector-associated constant component EACC1 [Streptomyces sp. NPDC004009]
MNIELKLSGSRVTEDDLRSLYEWLRADRRLRRDVSVSLDSSLPTDPEQQGQLLDVLSLVIGSGLNLASLVVAIASWREGRSGNSALSVTLPDGSKYSLANGSSDEQQQLLEHLQQIRERQ